MALLDWLKNAWDNRARYQAPQFRPPERREQQSQPLFNAVVNQTRNNWNNFIQTPQRNIQNFSQNVVKPLWQYQAENRQRSKDFTREALGDTVGGIVNYAQDFNTYNPVQVGRSIYDTSRKLSDISMPRNPEKDRVAEIGRKYNIPQLETFKTGVGLDPNTFNALTPEEKDVVRRSNENFFDTGINVALGMDSYLGKANIHKQIAKVKDTKVIKDLLGSLDEFKNASDDVLEATAKSLKNVNKADEVARIIKYRNVPFSEKTGLDMIDRAVDQRPFWNDEYKTYADYINKAKGKRGKIIYMTPDEYLKNAQKGFKLNDSKMSLKDLIASRSDKYVDEYAKAMKKGDKFPALNLEFWKTDSGGVGFTQEGVHRALAAKKAGVKRIPVNINIPTGKLGKNIEKTIKYSQDDVARVIGGGGKKTGYMVRKEATSGNIESMRNYSGNRGTGGLGTGDYFTIGKPKLDTTKSSNKIFETSYNPKKMFTTETLDQAWATQDFGRELVRIAHKHKEANYTNLKRLAQKAGIKYDEKLARKAISKLQKAEKGIERFDRNHIDQPINHYLKSQGFEGVLNKGADDHTLGSVLFRKSKSLKGAGKGIPEEQVTKEIKNIENIAKGAKEKPLGLGESFKQAENVPQEFKEITFGTYTQRKNKELWSSAVNRVFQDPVEAENFFRANRSDDSVATGFALSKYWHKQGNTARANDIINTMAERALEAGREVQANRLINQLTPEGVLLSTERKVMKALEKNPNLKVNWNDGVKNQLRKIAKEIQSMPDGREKIVKLHEMRDMINNVFPSTIGDKALALWKAGLLTSFRTHERNILGNAVNITAEKMADIPAVLADALFGKITGLGRSKTLSFRGYGKGSQAGYKQAKLQVTKGIDLVNDAKKWDYKKVNWGDSKLGKAAKGYTEAVFRTLGAEDKVFYQPAFFNSLYDQAKATALRVGRRGDDAFIKDLIKNPTADMLDIAKADAERATFKQRTAIGDWIVGGRRRLKTKGGSGNVAEKISQFLVPFTQVPAAIGQQVIDYSPLGMMKVVTNLKRARAGQSIALQREASKAFGRATVGSGIAIAGAYLMSKGLMTTDPPPSNSKEYEQWKAEGKEPYSVFVNGKWRSIRSVGPQFVTLMAGAKLTEEDEDANPLTSSGAFIGKGWLEQSSVTGLRSIQEAITAPDKKAETYVGQQLSSVVPNIVKDLGKATDQYERDAKTVPQRMLASLPFARQTLPPRQTSLGEPIENQAQGLGAFFDLFNSSKPISDPVIDELSRLSNVNQTATPSRLKNKQTILGQDVELTQEQLKDLERSGGMKIKDILGNLFQSASYQSISDEDKKKAIDNVVEKVRETEKLKLATIGTENKGILEQDKLDKEAQMEVAKLEFANTGESFKDMGDYVIRRASDGDPYTTPKTKYNDSLYYQQMQIYKKSDNLEEWMKIAEKKYANLQEILKDPTLDEQEKTKYQSYMMSLEQDIAKYLSYGGFKKGRLGRGRKAKQLPKIAISKGPSAGSSGTGPKPKTISLQTRRGGKSAKGKSGRPRSPKRRRTYLTANA